MLIEADQKVMISANSGMNKWDKIGIFLSAACLAHCLLLPGFLIMIPTVIPFMEANDTVHLLFAIIMLPIVIIAMIRGYQLHSMFLPLKFAGLGIALILGALFIEQNLVLEIAFASFGALILAIAHYKNYRLMCRCSACCSTGELKGQKSQTI